MTGPKHTKPSRETRKLESATKLLAVCGVSVCGAAVAAPPPLPVPCASAACGAVNSWVTSGSASLAQSGSRMTINQTSPTATLNWESFDIAAGNTVNFVQPSANSVALNRIFEANPSQIFGTLTANGQVYLLNPNGLIFGPNSVVNVGSLVASTLAISQAALKDGIAGAIQDGSPAFQAVDANGNPIQNLGVIDIQSGASITSSGGEVLIFAPTVTNEGTIQAPGGQAILGAGQTIFLSTPLNTSSQVRGLLIEVGGNGTVTNGAGGQIISTAGDVTLAGLAVNQMGRVSATTTIESNGSIQLEAQATTATSLSPGANTVQSLQGYQSGTLILGAGSSTNVNLQGSTSDTTVDATAQPVSSIELDGGEIELLDGASIIAPHGNVTLNALGGALVNPVQPLANLTAASLQPDSSRIWLAPNSVIDVSGDVVSQSASLNSLAVELNSVELADSPQQRNGPLHGQTVYIDIRQHGVASDGTSWVGTPIADLSGDVAAIQHNVYQRSLTGGTIALNSSGSVIVSPGATLNVSGGQIDWQAGYVKSSILVGANGQLYPMSAADPNLPYVGTLDSINQSDPHWGSTAYFTLPGYDPRGVYQSAYVQGEDAGSVSIVAPAFVLDGNIEGSAVRGPLQVNPPTPISDIPAGELYRYSDQVPLGGLLVLGNTETAQTATATSSPTAAVLQGLTFASGAVLASLTAPSGGAFDPSIDPLPSGFVSSLRPDLLGGTGVSQIAAYAEGAVTVPAGTALDPGPGGSVTLAAGEVSVSGTITTSEGSVTLESLPTPLFGAGLGTSPKTSPATQLYLAPGASIDVSGSWVNQDPSLGQSALAPLFIKGGDVQLLAPVGGSLVLSPGSSVNVSGGAQRSVSGALVAGRGGSITITAAPANLGNPQGTLELDASVSAFALEDGGSLAITLPALCVSSAACADQDTHRIDPRYLTDFGFEDVSLASDNGGLTVAQDVDSAIRQLNLEFTGGAFDSPSAGSLAGLTTVVSLPQYLRQHENLSLSSDILAPAGDASSVAYGDLTIAQGASLNFDPQASVSLTTDSRIFMNGSLLDPAGSIVLGITGGLLSSSAATVLGNQAIWLGSGSTLDVSGTVVLTPNSLGLQLGNVLPGGEVSVDAQRGYLLALPGSSILAAGTSATIDESSPLSGNNYQLATVASAGGSIELSAAEGMQLDGTLAAPPGVGASAAGGTLKVGLDGDSARIGSPGFDQGNPQLDASRTLTLTSSMVPTVVAEGASVPDSFDGQGQIAASTIQAGGFDNVSLIARDLIGSQLNSSGGTVQVVESIGSVALDPGVSLTPRASLVIDAPELSAASGKVSLSSAYVALGSDDTQTQEVDGSAAAGSANLTVSAQLIDLVGAMDLNGFGAATLSSSGDIRAIGVQLASTAVGNSGDSSFLGSLVSPGALTLTAQQIYPTTVTTYDVDLTGGTAAQSTLTLTAAPGTAGAVLSAAGSLTLQANQILDSGVLRAPMGTISLVGKTLTPQSGPSVPSTVNLSSGAVVSVSTDDLTIPFGETQGGLDWVYTLRAGAETAVYGTGSGDVAPPQKQVTVTADNFQLNQGATIDVSGGGDLVAYEFTPGLGGNNDVLSTSFAPNTYAVIPGLKLPFAPIDPHEDIGFTQSVGSSVYLSGGNGLPAGTYALLPARYALLPGAYLVTPVSGYTNLAAGQSVSQANGGVVVSGYRTVADTGIRDSQTSGWDVMPGSYAYKEAQYTLTSANTFFAAQASANSTATPRLPEDAGALSIQVTSAAQLAGSLLSSPADGGRGATLDLTATNLYIGANSADAPSGSAYVTINPAQLNALGAESILLGATRSVVADSTDLDVGAQNLIVGQNTTLTAPEIILAASGSLELESGAKINATGATLAAEPDFSAPAGTALLRASTAPQVGLTFTGDLPSSGAASLTVAQGALISAPGSMSFDASGTVDFSGSLSAANAAVRLGADVIGLGAVPSGFNGFAIAAALLGNLASSQLTLDAAAPISVYGPVNLTLTSLDIAAPGIDVSQSGALDVTAGSITLGNPGSTATAVAGTGSISLTAAHIALDQGAFTLVGADSTAVTATGDLTSAGSGSLTTAGSLSLTSPVMQSAAGADYTFAATDTLTTALPTAGAGAVTSASGPGGSFSFTGSSVELGGNIVLPGGRVEATADTGDVTVAGAATIDVAGFSETFDGETESAGGGTVGLSSSSGNITVAPTAVIDVSAGNGRGAGGELDISTPSGTTALDGQVHGGGASGQSGGSLSVEAQSLDFGSLVALAASGGFSGAVDIHERGSGDLVIGSGTTLQANDVELTADQGNIEVMGSIDAGNASGGTILLAAENNVEVSGQLSAGSPTRSDRGGTVELYSTDGGVLLDSGSSISVGGTASAAGGTSSDTGTVWLRTPAQNVLSVLGSGPHLVSLGGTITGAAHVYLEGYTQVAPDGNLIDTTVIGNAQTTAANFMAAAMPTSGTTVAQALGQDNNPAFTVVPGIEIDSPGSLTLSNVWDFSGWRYGPNADIPGVLSIRTGGSLILAPGAAISDGFDGTTEANTTSSQYNGFQLDPAMQTSWSYRLAAGANLTSANPLAVVTQTELAPEQTVNPVQNPGDAPYGSLWLQPGGLSSPGSGATDPTMIRTGTGSIEVAAAGDLELGNQASVIYTAGAGYAGAVAKGKKGILDKNLGLPDLAYPVGGGDVSIDVGQDLIGATSNQLFNDWLWRSGESGVQTPAPVSWLPRYDYFEQGIGALGGGDLTLRAGGNIVDLGANVPSSGIPEINASGGVTTTEVNAGILRVTAGGDIEGGKFLDLAGQAYITAGGQVTIGSDQAGPGTGLYPVLALGSGQFTMAARQGLAIDAIVDPTLLDVSNEELAQSSASGGDAGFSTYGDGSRVTLTSAGGDVAYLNRTTTNWPLQPTSTNIAFSGSGLELESLPPTLQAIALGGNVTLDGAIVLWPSAHGNLDLLAAGDVLFTGVTLDLSDANPSSLPSVTSPSALAGSPGEFTQSLGSLAAGLAVNQIYPNIRTLFNGADPDAPEPVHGGAYSEDGTPDTVPARVVALGGDVAFQAPPGEANFQTIFNIAKPIDIIAGGDIVDPTVFVQQFSSANITNVIAGGSITFPTARDPTGALVQDVSGITIAGPGRLDVQSGGTINLGTSEGISTIGNLLNPALPARGADVTVSAGISKAPDYASFINSYIAQSDLYDDALIQYVEQLTGATDLDKAQALTTLQSLPAEYQAPLLQQLLFDQLRAGGRAAAAAGAGHGNFTSAFDALEALFPGSTSATAKNDPYSGDILLYFSKLYTVGGGDINLLAPGGLINVGLAVAPTAFGVQKPPSDLGIVAQQQGSINMVSYSDIDVNLSRVFAADGGDILMWSTQGNIDAGRGARSAISAPPPTITIDPSTGLVTEVFPNALTGSGIQALSTTPGTSPGSVDLFAPHGVVNANEAGIVAGNITIYAVQVLGTNNISFSGTAVGVPVAVTGLGASLSAASSSGAAAGSVGESSVTQSSASQNQAPQAQAALNWLDVFVLGLGEAQCAPADLECIKKQQMQH